MPNSWPALKKCSRAPALVPAGGHIIDSICCRVDGTCSRRLALSGAIPAASRHLRKPRILKTAGYHHHPGSNRGRRRVHHARRRIHAVARLTQESPRVLPRRRHACVPARTPISRSKSGSPPMAGTASFKAWATVLGSEPSSIPRSWPRYRKVMPRPAPIPATPVVPWMAASRSGIRKR